MADNNTDPHTVAPKKRTRKPKAVPAAPETQESEPIGATAEPTGATAEPIGATAEPTEVRTETAVAETVVKPKRSSGKKGKQQQQQQTPPTEEPTQCEAAAVQPQPDMTSDVTTTTEPNEEEDSKNKKRGRKPKGGKIIPQVVVPVVVQAPKQNIILHLRCSLRDLSVMQPEPVESYDLGMRAAMAFETVPGSLFDTKLSAADAEESDGEGINMLNSANARYAAENSKEIYRKLKILEHNLHYNNLCDKKSACFWCTYHFQNPAVHIPKHFLNGSYHVYGCFCTPECAAAYLMEENLDSSTRFERYYLLNHVYKKVYDYNKNIKPAPNPHYTLDRYYGNLNIHEYRALLRNERLFLVVDKPLTKIMPELHEENDDMMLNNKIVPTNVAVAKKPVPKKPFSKLSILSEKFGLQ